MRKLHDATFILVTSWMKKYGMNISLCYNTNMDLILIIDCYFLQNHVKNFSYTLIHHLHQKKEN